MKRTILLALVLQLSVYAPAQEKDVQLFKEFIAVCSNYKQLPLHLQLGFSKTSNIPLAQDDTATFTADFYIQQQGAYIRFGAIEQIIGNDNVLMVLPDNRQMILSKAEGDIAGQLAAMTGPALQENDYSSFAARYLVSKKMMDNNKAVITLANKINLQGSSQPVETIELFYNTRGNIPEKIITVKRMLVPVLERYRQFSGVLPVINIQRPEGTASFYVKEDIATYDYRKIDHTEGIKLPVTVGERIVADGQGYRPLPAFSDYTLLLSR